MASAHPATARAAATLARAFWLCAAALSPGPACRPPPALEPIRLGDSRSLDPEVLQLVHEHVAQVASSPESARAHGTLGLVYEANGLWGEAEKSYANAALLDPGEPLWRYHRSIALREAGQSSEAHRLLRESAAKLHDEPGVQHRLGQSLLDVNDLAGARAAFSRALSRAPDQPECLVGLAGVEVAEGSFERARDLGLRAVRRDPAYKQAHHVVGLALRGLGQSQAAARELALSLDAKVRYLDDPLSGDVRRFQVNFVSQAAEASRLVQARQFDRAAALWERILKKRPDDPDILTNYGAALVSAGRIEQGIEVLERSLALDERKFGTHINLANAHLRAGRTEDALHRADRAVALGPQVARTHLCRAEILAERQDLPAAYAELKKAVELDARDLTVRVALCEICAMLGRVDEAREWCRAAVEIDPNHLPARVNLAALTLKGGDVASARAQIAELQRIAPDEPRVRALAEQVGLPASGSPR